ncbi:MAG: hypothetical protein AAF289_03305 [Cyanobacteria bacterium P01_A01_bin.135]
MLLYIFGQEILMRFLILWLGLAVLVVEGAIAPRALAQVGGAAPQIEETEIDEAEALLAEGDRVFAAGSGVIWNC